MTRKQVNQQICTIYLNHNHRTTCNDFHSETSVNTSSMRKYVPTTSSSFKLYNNQKLVLQNSTEQTLEIAPNTNSIKNNTLLVHSNLSLTSNRNTANSSCKVHNFLPIRWWLGVIAYHKHIFTKDALPYPLSSSENLWQMLWRACMYFMNNLFQKCSKAPYQKYKNWGKPVDLLSLNSLE